MDYIEKFKSELAFSNLASASVYRYTKTVERYLELTAGNPAFTRDEIMEFIKSLGDTTGTYKNWCLMAVKRFWEACAPGDKPWPLRRREGPRVEVRAQPFFKPEDVSALLNVAKGDKRSYAIIQVFIDTLCRKDELCKLERDNYGNGTLLMKLSKGEEYRTVGLTGEARRALDNYLKTRRDNNPALFVNDNGSRMSTGSVGIMIKSYLQQLGIYVARMGSHSFRRGGVTDLSGKGMSDLLIAKWGGWKSTAMIQRYAQLSPSTIEPEIRKLSPLRGGG